MHRFKKARSRKYARIAQLVEHDLAKVGVAGSSPVSRSYTIYPKDARVVELVDTLDLKSNDHYDRAGSSPASGTIFFARIAQLVEHDLAKVGVAGSSPVSRSLKVLHVCKAFFNACKFTICIKS